MRDGDGERGFGVEICGPHPIPCLLSPPSIGMTYYIRSLGNVEPDNIVRYQWYHKPNDHLNIKWIQDMSAQQGDLQKGLGTLDGSTAFQYSCCLVPKKRDAARQKTETVV